MRKSVVIEAEGEQGAGKTLLLGLLKNVLREHGIECEDRNGGMGPDHVLIVYLDERDREVLALANRKAGQ